MASCAQCTVQAGPGCGAAEISPPTAPLTMLLTEPASGLWPEQKARAQKRLWVPRADGSTRQPGPGPRAREGQKRE